MELVRRDICAFVFHTMAINLGCKKCCCTMMEKWLARRCFDLATDLVIYVDKKKMLVGVYLDPRRSSSTSKSAEGLQKVGVMKPLFWLTVGSFNKSSPRS